MGPFSSLCAVYHTSTCVDEIFFLQTSILTGDELSEKIVVVQQSSPGVPVQESGPPAGSSERGRLLEETPSPSSEETCRPDLSYQSAEEEAVRPQTETPDGEEVRDGGQSQAATDPTSRRSEEGECASDWSSKERPSDRGHVEQTSEDTQPAGGGGEQTDDCNEGGGAEIILTEANVNGTMDIVASAGSDEEQKDVQSNQEEQLPDGTDVVC